MNATQIVNAILTSNLSQSDMNQIANAFNTKRKMNTMVAVAAWKRGDKVTFALRSGRLQTAVVKKVNQKTVTCEAVLTPDELRRGLIPMSWNVSPSLLKAA